MPEITKNKQDAPVGKFRIRSLFYLTAALLVILSLWSYSPVDTAAIENGNSLPLSNWVGGLGAWLSGCLLHLFGFAAWILAFGTFFMALRTFLPRRVSRRGAALGLLALVVGATLLFGLAPGAFTGETERMGLGSSDTPESALSGGVFGQVLAAPPLPAQMGRPALKAGIMRHYLGGVGTGLIGWILIAAGLVLIYLAHWRDYFTLQHADAAAGKFLDQMGELLHKGRAETELSLSEAPTPTPAPAPEARIPMPLPTVAPVQEVAPEVALPTVIPVPENPEAEAENPKRGLLRGALALLRHHDQNQPEAAPESAVEAETIPEAAPEPLPVAEAVPATESPVEPIAEAAPTMPTPTPHPVTPPAPMRAPEPLSRPRGELDEFGNLKPELPTPNGEAARPPVLRNAFGEYVIPPITMLTKNEESFGEDPKVISDAKERLQATLGDFNINGDVTGHLTGPQVTRYEISLAPGVRVEKVSSISDNIMMSLQTKRIRILAPIPGRNVVGVEVPNSRRETITLRNILESDVWRNHTGEIPVVLGKNVSGKPIVTDLAKAPHLLIAGATGSGKSVCVNSLIMSLLFKFKPDELRMILVDPKVVEFTFYQTLPFLITPVINESNKALLALRWAVNEMEKRYRMLARVKTRNIKEYNSKGISNTGFMDESGEMLPEKLPLLVIIVDEFADLMMGDRNVRKDVETAIARIAQKGRAAGVHIVLATQRPSTNVLTGVIKANLPTKIALRVGSQIDSRVIVDSSGAEDLLGNGDMLFLPPNSPELERIQGTWVSNPEIEKVVDFISAQAEPQFNTNVVAEPDAEEEEAPSRGKNTKRRSTSASFDDDEEFGDLNETPNYGPLVEKYSQPDDDDLVKQAMEIVFNERQASTSYLQRRLRIGYNRAADLIDEFERRGIIGPARDGGNKREILVFDELTGE